MRPRSAVLALVVVGLLSLPMPPAQAALLPGSCPAGATEQPFLPWLDPLNYVLAPDGGLEAGGAGWTFTGGASVAEGNEPFYVHDEGDHRSLSLPAGASATTPAICVGIDRPVMRFLVKRTSGSLLSLSMLKVEVLYDGPSDALNVTSLGVITLGSGWQPTAPAPILASLLPLVDGVHAGVAFRFTAQSGSFRVDDVYVDPYAKR